MQKTVAPKDEVYLDNASTTKPFPEAVEAVVRAMKTYYGNPSSLHLLGVEAEGLVQKTRHLVARLIGAGSDEIYFTSGGTEANNLAVRGIVSSRFRPSHVVSTKVEHPSVLSLLERLEKEGHLVTLIEPDRKGRIDPTEVMAAVTPKTCLVSVMLVQNEIGTVEPCEEIGRRLLTLGRRKPAFHVDAVQGFGKLPIDVSRWGVDLLSASAHKIHGPKGVGALYVRKGLALDPLVFGGGQEKGMRSGTENVPGIAGFGAACEIWVREGQRAMAEMIHLRHRLIDGVLAACPQAVLHGPEDRHAAPHIVNFSFPGLQGETVLHALEARGVYVSTGSACLGRKSVPSPVVEAITGDKDEARSSIRFSLSMLTTQDEIDAAVQAIEPSLEGLSGWNPNLGSGRK